MKRWDWGIIDPRRCRERPCKKGNLFHCVSLLFSCNSFRKQAFMDLQENKKSEVKTSLFFAERGGFEPPVPVTQYVSLANWWFQPLTHLSVLKSEHFLLSGNADAKIHVFWITQKLFLKIFLSLKVYSELINNYICSLVKECRYEVQKVYNNNFCVSGGAVPFCVV